MRTFTTYYSCVTLVTERKIVRMNKFIKMLVCALFAFSCSSGADNHDTMTGVVKLNVATAPSSVQCLRVSAVDSFRSITKNVDIVNGVADPAPLEGLPTGDVTIGAQAYGVACSSVSSSTVATWLSYPITQVVQLVEGVPLEVDFVLRPNGDVTPSIDWQRDACNYAYDGNNGACAGLGCDPCKLLSGVVVIYCQQALACLMTASCVTQQNLFCQNVTNECSAPVSNFLQTANSSQTSIISSFITVSCNF